MSGVHGAPTVTNVVSLSLTPEKAEQIAADVFSCTASCAAAIQNSSTVLFSPSAQSKRRPQVVQDLFTTMLGATLVIDQLKNEERE